MRPFEAQFSVELDLAPTANAKGEGVMHALERVLPEGQYRSLVDALWQAPPGGHQRLTLEAAVDLVRGIPYANIRDAEQGVVVLLESPEVCSARISYAPAQRTLASDWIASLSVMLGFALEARFSQDFEAFRLNEDDSWVER